jgi:hypothetical protein
VPLAADGLTLKGASVVALIGGTGTILAAALNSFFSGKREVTARRDGVQVAALRELQDKALEVRRTADLVARSLEPSEDARLEFDLACSAFQIATENVTSEDVRAVAKAWLDCALSYFAGDPTIGEKEEASSWGRLYRRIGKELRLRY